MQPQLSISVVSHLQGQLLANLLADIALYCNGLDIETILTLNIVEELPFCPSDYDFPITIIKNLSPLGFAANHNQAFAVSQGKYFCVLNPDIRLNQNPFPALLGELEHQKIGVIAPLVINSTGNREDSARYFPSPVEIVKKVFGGTSATFTSTSGETVSFPDWVAGMFLLFRSEIYRELGGFNTRYFLYYEDVELCARLTLQGYYVGLCNSVSVIHDARRSSHARFRYLIWHLTSMLRFFLSPVYWKLCWRAGIGS